MTKENIREEKILKFIGNQLAKGNSYRGIARVLEQNYGIKVHHLTVKSVYNKFMNQGLAGAEEVRGEVGDHILNIRTQLININKITNELMKKYYKIEKEDPSLKNVTILVTLMREIQNHLVFQQRILEKLVESKEKVQVSNIHLTKVIINNLKEWERQKMIKILKMPDIIKTDKSEEEEEIKIENG